MCALCYVLSSVVLFSLYLLVGGYILQNRNGILFVYICMYVRWGAAMTKGFWWKKASLHVHSLKITKLSKWFFVLM